MPMLGTLGENANADSAGAIHAAEIAAGASTVSQ